MHGAGIPDIAWLTPEGAEMDDSFYLIFNAHYGLFSVPKLSDFCCLPS